MVKLWTWVMVSNFMSSTRVLTIVGQTIALSRNSANLVTGPCRVASLIRASEGGRWAVTSWSTSSSMIAAALAARCRVTVQALISHAEMKDRIRGGFEVSGRGRMDLRRLVGYGDSADLTIEAGPLRAALNISWRARMQRMTWVGRIICYSDRENDATERDLCWVSGNS